MRTEPLTYKMWAKIMAYVILACSVSAALICGVIIYMAFDTNVFARDISLIKKDFFTNSCIRSSEVIASYVRNNDIVSAEAYVSNINAEYRVSTYSGEELWRSANFDSVLASNKGSYDYVFAYTEYDLVDGYRFMDYSGRYYLSLDLDRLPAAAIRETAGDYSDEDIWSNNDSYMSAEIADMAGEGASSEESSTSGNATKNMTYYVETVINPDFALYDNLFWINRGIDLLWHFRYAVFAVEAVCLLVSLACVIFLMCGAAHRSGYAELVPGYFSRIPFELLTAAMAGWSVLIIAAFFWIVDQQWDGIMEAILILLAGVGGMILIALPFTGWLTSLAARVKLHSLINNLLVVHIYKLVLVFLQYIWKFIKRIGQLIIFVFGAVGNLISGIPLVWKTLIGIAVICTIDFFAWDSLGTSNESETFLVLERLVLAIAVLCIAVMLRRLQKGGEALAHGNLTYQTDTRYLVGDFRRHAQNLNSIGAGMSRAVEEQIKSERLKTELITNVSHDIKTPLTSIVNYVDLLGKTDDPEKSAQYLAVLKRQSDKLKKLTEDLVEMSKASSGNIEAHIAVKSISELLRQAVGEYSDRMTERKLEAVLTLPEKEVFIPMDGKLMWRVIDNLLSNACKYSQFGTRVFVDVLTYPASGSGSLDSDGAGASLWRSRAQKDVSHTAPWLGRAQKDVSHTAPWLGRAQKDVSHTALWRSRAKDEEKHAALWRSRAKDEEKHAASGRSRAKGSGAHGAFWFGRTKDDGADAMLKQKPVRTNRLNAAEVPNLFDEGNTRKVLVIFKNTSREKLNIPAEELMERFVRGDSARGGEGSGLGLNIARSLTELQGGKFELTVDGDLFKAMLEFDEAARPTKKEMDLE